MKFKSPIFAIFFYINIFYAAAETEIFSPQKESPGPAFSLFVEPHISVTTGILGEYLYAPISSDPDFVISYLEWESKPLISYGAKLTYKINDFSVLADFSSSLPFACGKMFDSDWMAYNDVKTTYSIHENTIKENYDFSLTADNEFHVNKKFSFLPFAEFLYSYSNFEAAVGQGWKGQASKSETGKNESWDSEYAWHGKVSGISYERQTFYIFTGISFKFSPSEKFSFALGGAVSPYTYTYSYDIHHNERNKINEECTTFYTMQTDFLTRFKYTLSAEYAPAENITLCFTVFGIYGREKKGELYVGSYGIAPSKSNSQYAGASINQCTFRLSARFKV